MKIAIVEDEKIWQKAILDIVNKHFEETIEAEIFNSGEEFLKENKEYDAIFMDIEMEGIDGFETIERYKRTIENPLVIILTSHQEMWKNGYKVEAFRYIDKSCENEIIEAVCDVKKKVKNQRKIKVTIVSGPEVLIDVRNIICVETIKRNVLIHTMGNDITCVEGIRMLEKELESSGFFCVHRSYLVNMDYVDYFDKKEVKLKNNITAYMSIRKYTEFKNRFIKWRFERGRG